MRRALRGLFIASALAAGACREESAIESKAVGAATRDGAAKRRGIETLQKGGDGGGAHESAVTASDGGQVDGDSSSAPFGVTGTKTSVKSWVETGLYKMRLGRAEGCERQSPAKAGQGASRIDAGASLAAATGDGGATEASKAPPKRRWLGFYLEIVAARYESFTTPRDVTLERGGIILEAKFHDPPQLPGCSPLMPQKLLRPGEKLRGFVLFDLPVSFQTARGPIVLAYRPTRWGKAPRVEVGLPDCLEQCPPATPEAATPRSNKKN